MVRRLESVLSSEQFRREIAQSKLAPPPVLDSLDDEIQDLAKAISFEGVATPFPEAPTLRSIADFSGTEEAVVLLQGRPSLLVRNNRFEVPRSGIWAAPLLARRGILEARLPSVGRIEVDDGSGSRPFGTAWIVAERVVATNRHVAEHFAMKKGAGARFLISFLGREYRSRIDFREEYGERAEFETPVEEVIFIEEQDRTLPDIALLRLARHDDLPEPIPLLETPPRLMELVAVIGYPAFDPRYGLDGLEAAKAIFGTIYDVKRLSPGYVIQVDDSQWFFAHDATTLGGNSGSVVLDVETGYAVGMHFRGSFREANYAIKASTLLDYVRRLAINVAVRKPLPEISITPSVEEAVEEAPVDYSDRFGYSEEFLGEDSLVPMPKFGEAIKPKVLKFQDQVSGIESQELKYTHFSVFMNAERRLCFHSAVNIEGKSSVSINGKRPGWRCDPRIPTANQILGECYGPEQEGKFSRGHMTRREDPNWGSEATIANRDTFHVTNACPQMQPFNAGIWNNLEDYALQNARQDDMRICVFTGPFFKDDDPELFGVKIPESFWKVITFIHDQTGKLCATGYTMSQKDFLPGEEFVYGQFETYQRSLKEIEALTGLSFGPLADLDPLIIVEEAPPIPLRSFNQIRFT